MRLIDEVGPNSELVWAMMRPPFSATIVDWSFTPLHDVLIFADLTHGPGKSAPE